MSVSELTLDQLSDLVARSVEKKLTEVLPSKENYRNSANYQGYHHKNYRENPREASATSYSPHYQQNDFHHHNYQTGRESISPLKHKYNHNYKRPTKPIHPIKIMVTYAESATEFWGQVLTPDLLDSTKQLENDLLELCPKLQPTGYAHKAGVYATVWHGQWYRCISCVQPDEYGNTTVQFVDYGNKEKRNLSEMVTLKTPKLLEIPFFACPFLLPNLKPIEDKREDALQCFDTDNVLTGFVCHTPEPSRHTDIYLNRPGPPEERPDACTTYNELMMNRGYAVQSEEPEVRPPQTSFQLRALQVRVRNLSMLCQKKDEELAALRGGDGASASSSNHDIRYPNHDIRYPNQDIRYPVDTNLFRDRIPISKEEREEVGSEKSHENKSCDLISEPSSVSGPTEPVISVEEVEVKVDKLNLNETITIEKSVDVSVSLLPLIEEIKQLNSATNDLRSTNNTENLKLLHEQLQSCGVSTDIVKSKQALDNAARELASSVAAVKNCSSSSLSAAVENREACLQAVIQSSDNYLAAISESNIEESFSKIEELLSGLSEENPGPIGNIKSPEHWFEELVRLEKENSASISDLHEQSSERLSMLSKQLLSCGQFLGQNVIGSVLNKEQPIVPVPDEDSFKDIGSTIKETRDLLGELTSASLRYVCLLSPVMKKLKRSLAAAGNTEISNLNEYLSSTDEIKAKADQARRVLETKPDLTGVKDIKSKLKSAKKQVRMALASAKVDSDDSSSESDEGKTEEIKDKMVALHELYKNEEEQLQTLQSIASSTHPELFVEYPLLKRMSQGSLLKPGWDLSEFILPNTVASINNQHLNVYCGFYLEEDVYFVEKPLQSVEGDMEEQALQGFEGVLDGCFAVILDKKTLRAFGATKVPPL